MAVGEQRISEARSVREKRRRTDAGSAAPRRFVWRFEYTLLIGVALLLTLFAIAFFYFSTDISNLKSYGYAGMFLINLIGAASILLPSPAAASVVGGGALLEDFLGVPAFIWVGLVAGLGEAIGEFSGYAAGYGGRVHRRGEAELRAHPRWMEKRGISHDVRDVHDPEPVLRHRRARPRARCRCRCAASSSRCWPARSSRTRGWPPPGASASAPSPSSSKPLQSTVPCQTRSAPSSSPQAAAQRMAGVDKLFTEVAGRPSWPTQSLPSRSARRSTGSCS